MLTAFKVVTDKPENVQRKKKTLKCDLANMKKKNPAFRKYIIFERKTQWVDRKVDQTQMKRSEEIVQNAAQI